MENDNLIFVNGPSDKKLREVLEDWITLYSDSIGDLELELFNLHNDKHVIRIKNIENIHFFMLVNYIEYPADIQYKVNVVGYTIGNEDKELNNKKLQVYIPKNDEEYDNVYIVTSENEQYKYVFDGEISKIDLTSRNVDLINYKEQDTLDLRNPSILKKKENVKMNKNNLFSTSFKVAAVIVCIIFIIYFILFD